jgi:hypothetical protein
MTKRPRAIAWTVNLLSADCLWEWSYLKMTQRLEWSDGLSILARLHSARWPARRMTRTEPPALPGCARGHPPGDAGGLRKSGLI